MTLLQWEARVPKTEIWRTILAWAKKGENLKWRKYYKIRLRETGKHRFQTESCKPYTLTGSEQENQALEMILHWVRRHGKEANKRAEYVLDKRRVKPTNIEQHVEQLLELMEQEYWETQHSMSPRTDGPERDMSVFLRQIFFEVLHVDIPNLVGSHQTFGLRKPTLEAQFSTTLDKILRLSSWTPSSTHNKHLRELLRNALQILNDLGGNEEYHDSLRDFMKRHTAFCAFTLDNADAITTEDSETIAELCKSLRRLAQNIGKIASTKAEQYQKLYEDFIAHREDLSKWLDSASPGQGKLYIWFLCITFYI
jgi:hypothetical protein